MASKAHCLYCFECLAAHFEHRDHRPLEEIIDLYDRYQQPADALSAREVADEHDEDVKEDGSDEEEDVDTADVADDESEVNEASSSAPRPQLPSITRLQAPSVSSRSSTSSSPSVMSANSSNSQLTSSSSTSTFTSRPTYASRLSVNDTFPMFVTWNTLSRTGHKSLRGCIGTFDPLPLGAGLNTYALTSAFDDARFSPIPASLIPSLSCSITLLADFEPCQDALDWTLGTHGLRISFTNRGRRYGATYLPDVAVEQEWNKEETVESLMRKAGWDGGSGGGVARRILRGASRSTEEQAAKVWDEVADFRAVRYTGLKAYATSAEWRRFQDWVHAQDRGNR